MVPDDDPQTRLSEVVRAQMPTAEQGSVQVVTAMAALLARVAFADQRYVDSEVYRVRQELSQVLGFGDEEIDAVCAALSADLPGIASSGLEAHTDVLRERLDVHMRADAVKVLIELAAADREISDAEVVVIRQVAAKLLVDEALLEALLLRARQQQR